MRPLILRKKMYRNDCIIFSVLINQKLCFFNKKIFVDFHSFNISLFIHAKDKKNFMKIFYFIPFRKFYLFLFRNNALNA